jgi:BolA family transcriptional regulator, general stress-responsive regulator
MSEATLPSRQPGEATVAANTRRMQQMRERLMVLAPTILEIQDDSVKHHGHAGAQTGLGHFNVRLHSSQFAGLSAVARHRLIYQALGSMMQTDIHALGIQTGIDAVS